MGVKLHSILGLFLILEICSSTGNETIHQNVSMNKVDTNLNLIEKLPKTDAELNIANKDTQRNIHNVKLGDNQSYSKSEDPYENNDTKSQSISNNVVEKENKDNSIKQDSNEKRRVNDSRSINIKKYISPEFQNNVYTHPIASDIEKHIDQSYHKSTTRKYPDYANLELSTPKTEFFDKKFSEAKQKLDQEYEFNGFEDFQHHNDHDDNHDGHEDFGMDQSEDENSSNLQMHGLFSIPHTSLEFKEQTNISKNSTIDKNAKHDDLTVERMKKVNFVSSYGGTSTYKYNLKEELQHPETSSAKTHIQTTGKSTALTKPPTNNNGHILSNKIESETIKAIRSFPESSTKRFGDENELVPKEQTVEENKLNVHNMTAPTRTITGDNSTTPITTIREYDEVTQTAPEYRSNFESTTPNDEFFTQNYESSTRSDESTTRNGESSMRNVGSISRSDESTAQNYESTTQNYESSTRSDESTTRNGESSMRNVESISRSDESTTQNYESTTQNYESTTQNETATQNDGFNTRNSEFSRYEGETTVTYIETTTESNQSTTNSQEVITTIAESSTGKEHATTAFEGSSTNSTESTTDNKETTAHELKITEGMTSEGLVVQTSESTVEPVSSPSKYTDVTGDMTVTASIEQTTISTTNYDTPDQTTTSGEATTVTDGSETTEGALRVSKGVVFTESTSQTIDTTTDMIIPIDVANATFKSPEMVNTTTETPTTKVPSIVNKSSSTVEITTVVPTITTVEFVHIETRDNHTTLVPETLVPNLSYPTPYYNHSRSVNVTDISEQTTFDTTPGDEVTESSAESSAATEHATIDDPEDNKGKIAAIVISTVGALCLVLLAALLYLMRKRQKRFNYKQRCRPVNLDDYSVDNLSVYNSVRRKADRQSKRSYGNPAFEDPVAVTHPLNFPALAKFADNTEDIKAEFEEVPQITAKTSELPEGCEPKNRYANVIPLPETRVFLKTIDGYLNSDYINANYVTGPKNTKGYYIACQAPLQNTVDDFWRMIWEQQSKVILMITHFFENGMDKCFDYLPPSEILDCNRLFGDFQVTLKKRDVKDKYIISSLQLKNMVSNSWREVTHFWYLGWPEKGVPSEGNSLIAFLIEARSFMKSSTLDKKIVNGDMNGSAVNEVNPVVVHCSPGTGRTGVVIACDIAIREFEQTRLVDIPKIVYRIRRDRASAVQTKEQYIFIYKVVSLYATKLSGGGLESF